MRTETIALHAGYQADRGVGAVADAQTGQVEL
jgi:hypothetical protein